MNALHALNRRLRAFAAAAFWWLAMPFAGLALSAFMVASGFLLLAYFLDGED